MGSRLESNSNAVRKRIENHTFDDEQGEEYEGSAFGGFSDYFRRKKIKLQNLDAQLRSEAGDSPQIFRGTVAHVNGYTQPSLNDIHKLIVTHGGGFMQYLDGKTTVTHIIASSLTPKKAVEFKRYRIVKPAWVVDSVKAGKLLPWNDYRVVDEGAGQRILGFDNGKIVSQASVQSRGYKDQTERSWYTSQLKAAENAPSSSSRSPLLKQQPPTPEVEDEIDDRPHARKPENSPFSTRELVNDTATLPLSPTSSPTHRASASHALRHQPAVSDHTHIGSDEGQEPKVISRDMSGEEDAADKPTPNDDPIETLPETKRDRHLQPEDLRPDDLGQSSQRSADGLDEGPASKRTKMTAEEHNAILLADPRVRKSTVVNPDFLEQYYRESRLHHLSTWKADLKAQLQAMAAEKSSQKPRPKRVQGTRRYIMHVDFDSFFAAVSLKKNPEYVDKPAVVAHGQGSGSEIASCNYPARKFGIKNGMWMKRAQDLCPEVKILPYDFPAYEEASRAFYDAILATDGVVQSVSVDEALVDISIVCIAVAGTDGKKMAEGAIYREQKKADEIAQALRDDVKSRTGCNVSVGIGGNILLAKLALRKAKPAGQYQVKPEEILDFVGNLEVEALPGVAYSIGGKLEEIGIKFVKDVRDVSRERLVNTLGPKTGEKLWEYARGIDRTEVGDQVIRKSVSCEVNWGVRFVTNEQVDEFIHGLCDELNKRLVKSGVKGRQLTLKVMRRSADAPLDPPKHLGHGKCDTFNKSILLGVATNAPAILTKEVLSMLRSFGFTPGELRGIGVQVTKLEALKAFGDGQAESSQRRLVFKTDKPVKPLEEKTEDPIETFETPTKPKSRPDQIAFGADQLNQSSPSRKPLNTLGTQFILPTQVDPKVLAELPDDIRAKLAAHVQPTKEATKADHGAAPDRMPMALTALPNESQLDPEILNALPEDMRAEVLAFYQISPTRSRTREQSLLPQSPRKNRTMTASKRPQPTTRKRGGGLFSRSRGGASSGNSTLTQSNFIAARTTRDGSNDPTTDTDADTEGDLDADFLAALPEDIRREVLEEQRRARLKKRSALAVPITKKKKAPEPQQPLTQRTITLPPRPPKPTFTAKRFKELPDLRDAVRKWYEEFREEGPYEEDVDALGKYLASVVKDESDLGKAAKVVRWMGWVVEEGMGDAFCEREKWDAAVEKVKALVRDAVKERGLGEVEF